MLKINLSKQSNKFLNTLLPKQAKQIAQKLIDMSSDPKPIDCKKLSGSDFLRVNCGEYRIIYDINIKAKSLEIIIIGKRNDDEVYRKLKRKQH